MSTAVLAPVLFTSYLILGSGAFFLVWASFIHTGKKELGSFLPLLGILNLLLASNSLVLWGLGSSWSGTVTASLMGINQVLSSAVFLAFVLAVHGLLQVSWRVWGNGITVALALLCALDPGLHLAGAPVLPVYGILSTAYALALLLLFWRRIPGSRTRTLVLLFLILTGLAAPGIAFDLVHSAAAPAWPTFPAVLPFFGHYLGLLSLGILAVALRSAASRPGPSSAAADAESAPQSPGLERLIALHALSSREGEIARMLAQGLGNKQIAAALGISSRTVGNHIYNLYRKMGISSRFELLGALIPSSPASKASS